VGSRVGSGIISATSSGGWQGAGIVRSSSTGQVQALKRLIHHLLLIIFAFVHTSTHTYIHVHAHAHTLCFTHIHILQLYLPASLLSIGDQSDTTQGTSVSSASGTC